MIEFKIWIKWGIRAAYLLLVVGLLIFGGIKQCQVNNLKDKLIECEK